MITLRIEAGPGLARIRDGIRAASALAATQVPASLALTGATCAQALSDAAPRGAADGVNPPGDGPGPLAESFQSEVEMSATASGRVLVQTRQPTKLRYVRRGTGIYGPGGQRIVPRVKKALYWKGAAHPVKSVAGQQPNDFVTPVTQEAAATMTELFEGLAVRLAETLEGGGVP